MKRRDIKHEMRGIASDLIASKEGASWLVVRTEFENNHSDDLLEFAGDYFGDYLAHLARTVVDDLRRESNGQQQLPGMGGFDSTVTYRDGEGNFRVKDVRLATVEDLEQDLAIHDENVASAVAAQRRAIDRNSNIIPVMEQEGFDVAGDAIDFIVDNAPPEEFGQ